MSELVKYFGYGANRDPRMIAAILGKTADQLTGDKAVLKDFGLAIQKLDQIPATAPEGSDLMISPRDVIEEKWGTNFKTYTIFPKTGSYVLGTIWELTAEERERVRDWELVGDWYKDDSGIAQTNYGNLPVVTESIGDGQAYESEVNGLEYETWLAPPVRFEIIAGVVRHEYDQRLLGDQKGDSHD